MTRIGVMSDSHDNVFAIKNAIELFKRENVDYIFHCGDIVAPFALKVLLTADIPLRIVFGNNDGEKNVNRQVMKNFPQHKLTELILIEEIDGKKIAMTHGHVTEVKELLLHSGNNDVVLTGHTHQKLQQTLDNGVLHVNPGETCGWVTEHATVSIIELEPLSVTFKDVAHLPK